MQQTRFSAIPRTHRRRRSGVDGGGSDATKKKPTKYLSLALPLQCEVRFGIHFFTGCLPVCVCVSGWKSAVSGGWQDMPDDTICYPSLLCVTVDRRHRAGWVVFPGRMDFYTNIPLSWTHPVFPLQPEATTSCWRVRSVVRR